MTSSEQKYVAMLLEERDRYQRLYMKWKRVGCTQRRRAEWWRSEWRRERARK